MTKILGVLSTCAAIAAMATMATMAGNAPAKAADFCNSSYYYSAVQPDWSVRGTPCWKPWDQNPMVKWRAAHR